MKFWIPTAAARVARREATRDQWVPFFAWLPRLVKHDRHRLYASNEQQQDASYTVGHVIWLEPAARLLSKRFHGEDRIMYGPAALAVLDPVIKRMLDIERKYNLKPQIMGAQAAAMQARQGLFIPSNGHCNAPLLGGHGIASQQGAAQNAAVQALHQQLSGITPYQQGGHGP